MDLSPRIGIGLESRHRYRSNSTAISYITDRLMEIFNNSLGGNLAIVNISSHQLASSLPFPYAQPMPIVRLSLGSSVVTNLQPSTITAPSMTP